MKVLQDLPTPSAVVDLDRIERNCEDMIARAAHLGVALRPHVKTHKCVEIARLQVGRGPRKLTVSTLAEAASFARAGFDDLTWAVPIAPQRIFDALELAAGGITLNVLLDHDDVRAALQREAQARAMRVPVFLKVDCGYHRAGVDPEDPETVDLAMRIADSRGLVWAGILTHAGQAYACRDRGRIREVAEHERDVMAAFAERVRGRGLDVPVVSVGSTPTARVAQNLTGTDEIRPGNYVFFDAFQAAIGSCTPDDIAFSVLATVIGVYPARRSVVLDTGGTALSLDPGPRHVDPDCGFGRVLTVDGRATRPELRIAALSQEHARVEVPDGATAPLRPGDRVRVVPNHSCLAAGLFDRYVVVRGARVVDEWRPAKYWSASTIE